MKLRNKKVSIILSLAVLISMFTVMEPTKVKAEEYPAVTPSAEITVPEAVLIADSSVQPGSSFTVGIVVKSVAESVYAQDITLNYDANVFEYISSAGANNNIQIAKEDKAAAGKARLVTANIEGVTGESVHVLNVTFKVKAGIQNTTGSIAITQAKLGIAPQGTVLEAALDSKNIAIGSSGGGSSGGGGSSSSSSSAVVDRNLDLNRNGRIDTDDLTIVANNYGKDFTGTDWETAKASDVNGDNKVDVSDLAYIASKILE